MAARIENFFDNRTKNSILESKLLVVGAGGIGCELLKNLVLTGFENIYIIDLDTIDVSNLNRQFLFQKIHVGKSKAEVAKESAEKLNPKCKIIAYHDSITNLKYNVEFYRQFSAVTNALDNMAARKHVNRMCLAAEIPLIESGSAGYMGQVSVYKKKLTDCYECDPRPAPKDYPTCTIRNTPSESIHCVVWAKHLFNQLFGEEDSHNDVSPDTSDLPDSAEAKAPQLDFVEARISTREWAKNCNYEPQSLFKKLFHDDVTYLLEMKHLWEDRRPPIPLEWEQLPDAVAGSSVQDNPGVKDQELWSIKRCAEIFQESLKSLTNSAEGDNILVWDKDDKDGLDFVAACSNLRSFCFRIKQKSRFEIKSMAGNIIPAIATTNAMIGGLIVLQLIKVLKEEFEKCRNVILNSGVNVTRNKLITSFFPPSANKKCFVCSPDTPEVHVKVNLESLTVKTLEEKILKEAVNMIAPDVLVSDGKGTLLISSDPDDDMSELKSRCLTDLNILCGTRLQCDDFFQQLAITLVVAHSKDLADQDFTLVTDIAGLKPEESGSGDAPKEVEKSPESDENEKDTLDEISMEEATPSKRKFSDDENGDVIVQSKKSKTSEDLDNDVVVV